MMAVVKRDKVSVLVCALLWMAFLSPTAGASEAVQLQDISLLSADGQQLQLRMEFNAAPKTPRSFVTHDPERIIIDLPKSKNAIQQGLSHLQVRAISSVRVIDSAERTRVIVSLRMPMKYELHLEGRYLYLRLRSESYSADATSTSTAKSTAHRDPGPIRNEVSRIDFRRGKEGVGRLIIECLRAPISANVHEQAGRLMVDLHNTAITEAHRGRLDVRDFATLVRKIDSRQEEGYSRIGISVIGDYEYVAHQSGKSLIIDIKQRQEEAAEKDKQNGARYKGEKLSLNFQDIEVRSVLQIIAEFTGHNIVASDSVNGKLTLRLKNVPWDEAMDIILSAKGLSMRRRGNIILVAPSAEIAEQDRRELEVLNQREKLAALRKESIQVNYAKASNIAALLKSEKNTLLSERGSITIDERTNKLLVKETPANIKEIRTLVAELDIPVRQVLIESRIVIATDDFSRDIGARFGASGASVSADKITAGSGTAGGANDILSGGGQLDTGGLPGLDDRLNVNLPVTNAAGQFALSVLSGNLLLDMELSALQMEGRGEVISNPRVITSNQKEAQIEQGVEIPYLQSTSSGATSVAFKKAVLSLKVVPQITPDDRIIMDLAVSKDSVGEIFNGVPSVNTREVNTQVLVDDGDTVVLGGIYEQTVKKEIDSVPVLGAIPIIGALFRQTRSVDDKAELLIFVTPKILRDGRIKP